MLARAVQLKISLDDTNPSIWRRILILENSSLRTLRYAIQDVFWWKGYHSYLFEIDGKKYSDPEIDMEFEGWLDDSKYKVGKIVEKHSEFKFIYDFGDWWSHNITFEKFIDADLTEKYPVCVDGEYSAPPEDWGGPHGFEEFKKAVSNPKNKNHKEMVGWYSETNYGRKYNSKSFDLEFMNLRIGRRQKPRLKLEKASIKKKPKLTLVSH
ncbi:MAG: plasmid pRiA4b ORF-3 family protein [Pseudomonadota bacterium]|nr:plasmid pRiA4b ORF-3 family protein [Pseudomonadota bacterium]